MARPLMVVRSPLTKPVRKKIVPALAAAAVATAAAAAAVDSAATVVVVDPAKAATAEIAVVAAIATGSCGEFIAPIQFRTPWLNAGAFCLVEDVRHASDEATIF